MYPNTHTFIKRLLARHCLGTMDVAENKTRESPVPEEQTWGLAVDKSTNKPTPSNTNSNKRSRGVAENATAEEAGGVVKEASQGDGV